MGKRLYAATLVALGLAVLAGWVVRSPRLVQVLPGVAPMQPNTALGILALGVAIGMAPRRPWVALVSMGLGLLALLEYGGVRVGASTLLIADPWVAADASRPGLMSVITAVLMILAGTALVSRSPRVEAVGGAAVAAVGTVALVGHAMAGGRGVFTWATLAIPTACGFVLVGAACVSIAYERPLAREFVRAASGVAFAAVAVVWVAVASHSAAMIAYGSATAALLVVVAAQRSHTARIEALRNLASVRISWFVMGVTHDLRAPARQATEYATMALGMLERGEYAAARAAMQTAVEKTRRSHEMIAGLEAFNGVAGSRQPVRLDALVRDALEALEVTVPTSIACGDAHVPEVCRTVILNLVSNAAKYARGSDPLIEFEATEGRRSTVVVVRDNGKGFPTAFTERIFEPFFRAHDSQPGSGVGLSLCAQIVTQLGGRIWAHSDGIGHGAVFTFEVPNEKGK